MKLISHRGNISGPNPTLENSPDYIDKAIDQSYDVEVDLWFYDNVIWLGHDLPVYAVNQKWLDDRVDYLWLHCKNVEFIDYISKAKLNFNYFWHQTDKVTLTSHKHIWAYPGEQPISNSIAVMPEMYKDDLSMCGGICSDYIERYR
jgi:hypothetical protein